MTHRAEQIVDAVVAALEGSATLDADVFRHRSISVSEAEMEVPAVSVTVGDDAPADGDGAANLAFFDSLLEVVARIVVAADDEQGAITALMNRRVAIHAALMADRTLGLAFVMDTRYGGASAPEIQVADRVIGGMDVRWQVHYRMGVTNPS